MSSDILSRPLDINKFGLIFAGAQKNIGPSGVTVVIMRKDLAERAPEALPSMLQYRTHIKGDSLYNTPPTFGIYIIDLVLKWVEKNGGLEGLLKKTETRLNFYMMRLIIVRFIIAQLKKTHVQI